MKTTKTIFTRNDIGKHIQVKKATGADAGMSLTAILEEVTEHGAIIVVRITRDDSQLALYSLRGGGYETESGNYTIS